MAYLTKRLQRLIEKIFKRGIKMKTETEKMLAELTKDDSKLKEYAEQYGRQLDYSVKNSQINCNHKKIPNHEG